MKQSTLAVAALMALITAATAGHRQSMASYYSRGQIVASGAHYNPMGLTTAHRTLPFGTRVLVTNLRNSHSVVVTVNDRGPAARTGRDFDLSLGAAIKLDMISYGVVPISYEVLK